MKSANRLSLSPRLGTWLTCISVLLTLSACSAGKDVDFATNGLATEREVMTGQRLGELIRQIDPNATMAANTWRFEAGDKVIAVVFDESADRMRIIIPITEADKVTHEQRTRMLQANFDSALDARYAIAQDLVWGTYIHPLSPLTETEFLLGLGQTISVVETFGDTYSSGMFVFGAGDSAEIQRQRILDLLRKRQT